MRNQRGPLHIIDTPTTVECGKDVRYRRTFRSLVECMVPCCGFQQSNESDSCDTDSINGTIVTGTFFGYRKGRVCFCIQEDPRNSSSPLLLLDFSLPTAYLAKEMEHGLLRIVLKCHRFNDSNPGSLLNVPAWSMYFNGRKVGFALRRSMNVHDKTVFKLMQSISVGAGILRGTSKSGDGDLLYLRANFDRVIGSWDSESFHMINPDENSGQELSIYLIRSSKSGNY